MDVLKNLRLTSFACENRAADKVHVVLFAKGYKQDKSNQPIRYRARTKIRRCNLSSTQRGEF